MKPMTYADVMQMSFRIAFAAAEFQMTFAARMWGVGKALRETMPEPVNVAVVPTVPAARPRSPRPAQPRTVAAPQPEPAHA
jgi:hypothetical protein